METIVTLVLLFLVAPTLFIAVYWLMFNNANGERYLKYRTQGPFAPMPKAKERASDAALDKSRSE